MRAGAETSGFRECRLPYGIVPSSRAAWCCARPGREAGEPMSNTRTADRSLIPLTIDGYALYGGTSLVRADLDGDTLLPPWPGRWTCLGEVSGLAGAEAQAAEWATQDERT